MNTKGTMFLLLAVGLLLAASCKEKDLFDKVVYQELVRGEYPIDTVDQYHDWSLLQTMMVAVTANVDEADDVVLVQVLSDNPYSSKSAEVLAERTAAKDERVRLTFEMPLTQRRLYAAAVSSAGKYYVVPFNTTTDNVDFSSGVISYGGFTAPVPQTFTYLYEATFPEPGDFDYNDVVLRISKTVSSSREMKIRVTLAAVGTNKQVAAAIRLPGISYDQVEQVTIDDGAGFNAGFPFPRTLINQDNLLVRGSDGSAVISLFEHAHWALNPELLPIGSIAQKYLNTERSEDADRYAVAAEKMFTYTLRLKEGADASYMSLSDLDPFIIESYNSINYEVHTYRYKFSEVLWSYSGGNPLNYDDHLAWALVIPAASFRYPRETIPLCTYRNGEVFGAYNTYRHSFGEWGHDRTIGADWYQFPTTSLVF